MAHQDEPTVNRIWQDQPAEGSRMTLDDIRQRSRRFETKVGRRNLREYAAALFVIVFASIAAWRESNNVVVIGEVLMAAGALFVVYFLQKRGSARRMPPEAGLMDCLDFHRSELTRQRDLLRSVWWWYLLPLVPGPAFIVIGRAIERPDRQWLTFAVAGIFALTFIAVGKLNDRAARKVQRRIDGLDEARQRSK